MVLIFPLMHQHLDTHSLFKVTLLLSSWGPQFLHSCLRSMGLALYWNFPASVFPSRLTLPEYTEIFIILSCNIFFKCINWNRFQQSGKCACPVPPKFRACWINGVCLYLVSFVIVELVLMLISLQNNSWIVPRHLLSPALQYSPKPISPPPSFLPVPSFLNV